MNILLVSNMYPDPENPNFGVFVKNTAVQLADNQHDIHNAVMTKQKGFKNKLTGYLSHYINVVKKGLWRKDDVIYAHYASLNALPLLIIKAVNKNKKIYINVHGSDVTPQNKLQAAFQPLVSRILKKADKVICPSAYYKSVIAGKYGLPEKKISVFPSGGIDTAVFFPETDREKLFQKHQLSMEKKYIAYVGRIEYNKGWDTFLDTLSLLKQEGFLQDKKIIVVGNGKQFGEYESKVKATGLQDYIIQFDFLSQEELKDIFNIADVFCFPTKLYESLGLVGIEAMACGTPVIGSRRGGVLDFMEDDYNGFLFEPGNTIELKMRIEQFFSLPEEKRGLYSKNSAATAARYDQYSCREQLKEIFADTKA